MLVNHITAFRLLFLLYHKIMNIATNLRQAYNRKPDLLNISVVYRCHEYSAGTAVNVDQALSGCCGTDQRLTGPFYSKVQTATPCDRHIAVHLEYVILQLNLYQFLFGTRRLQAKNAVPHDAEIEESFVAGDSG